MSGKVIDFKKSFEVVELWLYDRGYIVNQYTDAEDSVYYDAGEILINSRKHPESKFYTLLHECGHILINDNRDRLFNLSRETQAIMGGPKHSRKKRVAVISEEIEAWKRGERLAKRLGLKINEDKFDRCRANAIMSYIEWARD